MIQEVTHEELDNVTGGIAPVVYMIGAFLVRRYAMKVVKTAVASAVGGAVAGALRE